MSTFLHIKNGKWETLYKECVVVMEINSYLMYLDTVASFCRFCEDATFGGINKHTWLGALPVNVDGSRILFSCWWTGTKYDERRILSTRSLSPPSCFTTLAAWWDRTRICSWHSYVRTNTNIYYILPTTTAFNH